MGPGWPSPRSSFVWVLDRKGIACHHMNLFLPTCDTGCLHWKLQPSRRARSQNCCRQEISVSVATRMVGLPLIVAYGFGIVSP